MTDPTPIETTPTGPEAPVGSPLPEPEVEESRVRFKHKCTFETCENAVEFDDEPFCPEHSPENGQRLPGFSARQHLRLERAVSNRVDIPAEDTDYVQAPPVLEGVGQAETPDDTDILADDVPTSELPQPEEG